MEEVWCNAAHGHNSCVGPDEDGMATTVMRRDACVALVILKFIDAMASSRQPREAVSWLIATVWFIASSVALHSNYSHEITESVNATQPTLLCPACSTARNTDSHPSGRVLHSLLSQCALSDIVDIQA